MPTQILLNEDGHGVCGLPVTERPVPETMSIVFLLPRVGGDAAARVFALEARGDLWAAVYYTRDTPAPSLLTVSGAPRFQSNPEAIVADLERVPRLGRVRRPLA